MKTVWKVLLGLALVVPMGAYVVGSLAASASEDPAPRHTIQIEGPERTPAPTRTPRPTPTETGGVEVITPHYDDFDDHDDHGDDDGDDSSGHGGGDDSSGHGGGDHGGGGNDSGHGGGGDDD